MQKFSLIVLLIFFGYFASTLFITPGLEPEPFSSPESFSQSQPGPAESSDFDLERNDEFEALPRHSIVLQPGIIERTRLQANARELFTDALLESDSRPENLLRSLERSFSVHLLWLVLTVFWSTALLLSAFSIYRSYWFARPMTLYLLFPSLVFILGTLLTNRRNMLFMADGESSIYVLLLIIFESTILFLGSAVAIGVSTLNRPVRPFLSHLAQPDKIRNQTNYLEAGIQIGWIIVAALIAANVFLLPLYMLQISFERFFAAILLFGLALLAIFYIRAYLKVAHSKHEAASYTVSSAFLGFRIIRNTLFLLSISALIIIAIGLVTTITLLNIDFLESIQVLEPPPVL